MPDTTKGNLQKGLEELASATDLLIAMAWCDEEFKNEFIGDPQFYLEKMGVVVPGDLTIQVDECYGHWIMTTSGKGLKLYIPFPTEKPDWVTCEKMDLIDAITTLDVFLPGLLAGEIKPALAPMVADAHGSRPTMWGGSHPDYADPDPETFNLKDDEHCQPDN